MAVALFPLGWSVRRLWRLDRAAFASKSFARVNGAHFVNSPRSYDIAPRADKNGQATLSVRLHTFPRPRLCLPAESGPPPCTLLRLAALLYDHRRYMKQTYTVLDPFCGAGLLPIERKSSWALSLYWPGHCSPAAFFPLRAPTATRPACMPRYSTGTAADSTAISAMMKFSNLPFGHRGWAAMNRMKGYTTIFCSNGPRSCAWRFCAGCHQRQAAVFCAGHPPWLKIASQMALFCRRASTAFLS